MLVSIFNFLLLSFATFFHLLSSFFMVKIISSRDSDQLGADLVKNGINPTILSNVLNSYLKAGNKCNKWHTINIHSILFFWSLTNVENSKMKFGEVSWLTWVKYYALLHVVPQFSHSTILFILLKSNLA